MFVTEADILEAKFLESCLMAGNGLFRATTDARSPTKDRKLRFLDPTEPHAHLRKLKVMI